MRTLVLTDLHANLQAASRILEEAQRLSVDRVVCLGDTVGYGADPNAVCDLMRERAAVAVLGNHDAAAVGRMDPALYYDAVRESLDWTRALLSEENRAWLAALPYSWREGHVLYSHGAPADPEAFQYVFALSHARKLAPIFGGSPDDDEAPRVVFVGHAHLVRVYAFSGREVNEVRAAGGFSLRKGYRYLVSVGSGGQPRDYDPRAAFAIYDDAAGRVELHRVEYDAAQASRRILEEGLPPNFARRLLVGM